MFLLYILVYFIYMCGNFEICVFNCLIMNNGDMDEFYNFGIDVILYCVYKIIFEEGGVFFDYLMV